MKLRKVRTTTMKARTATPSRVGSTATVRMMPDDVGGHEELEANQDHFADAASIVAIQAIARRDSRG